jgi:hypothetical protein
MTLPISFKVILLLSGTYAIENMLRHTYIPVISYEGGGGGYCDDHLHEVTVSGDSPPPIPQQHLYFLMNQDFFMDVRFVV